MILFIKHIDIEGPETIGTFFKKQGYQSQTINLQEGDSLPESLQGVDAVVSLGGPMNVDEEDKYPFLKEENEFVQSVIKQEVPFMGLCLGSQILAKASGAQIGKSPTKEVGFFSVQLTDDGFSDPFFNGIEKNLDVYHWHEDMWALPEKATLLASSQGCPHQAFRIGPCAYGLQFHIEITDKSIRDWSDKYITNEAECLESKKIMLGDYQQKREGFDKVANDIYKNFLNIMIRQREDD